MRKSEIAEIRAKVGRSGEMLFVTVRHTYTQDGEPCMREEQDLVYRSGDAAAAPQARPKHDPPVATTPAWSSSTNTNSRLLFRFSALTGNAHRIHYDEAYATETEGYPGLVVHGPLLALYMAELVRDRFGDRLIREFTFRLQRPAFLGDDIRVEGTPKGSTVALAVTSAGASIIHASATAVLE